LDRSQWDEGRDLGTPLAAVLMSEGLDRVETTEPARARGCLHWRGCTMKVLFWSRASLRRRLGRKVPMSTEPHVRLSRTTGLRQQKRPAF